jgi:hypothetical protein
MALRAGPGLDPDQRPRRRVPGCSGRKVDPAALWLTAVTRRPNALGNPVSVTYTPGVVQALSIGRGLELLGGSAQKRTHNAPPSLSLDPSRGVAARFSVPAS